MECAVYISTSEANLKIRELGLRREKLLSSVKAAVAAVGSCTSDSPPIAPGWMAWHAAVVRLRQEFQPTGWVKDDTANFASIIDHANSVRIAVANTDEGTGNPVVDPTNRSRKGELGRQAIEANQWLLPYPGWSTDLAHSASMGLTTWYLCLYVQNGTVRAELSLPTSCDDGYFGRWSERIMLISTDDDWATATSPADDAGPEFEVRVARK